MVVEYPASEPTSKVWVEPEYVRKGRKGDPGSDVKALAQTATAQATADNARGMARSVINQINDQPDYRVIFENALIGD